MKLSVDLIVESNLDLSERLYELRKETKEAFDEAKRLEDKLKSLEREQKDVYSVSFSSRLVVPRKFSYPLLAIRPSLPPSPASTCNDSPR